MSDERQEIDLLQQELSNILKQLQGEMDNEVEVEEIGGVNLKELEQTFNDGQPKMDLKFVKCHPDAVSPSYNYPTDSGFDLHSILEIVIPPFGRALIPTGLKFDIDEGYELQVRTKSGLAINHGLIVLNSPGTVDCGYTGEVQVIVFNTNQTEFIITKGMKVAQAVLSPVVNGRWVQLMEVENVIEKDRGDNGFGSTGIK